MIDELVFYPDRPFGYPKWCHCWSDTDNLEELHKFAASLGLKKAWFQASKPGQKYNLPHYDLTESKYKLALRKGAILTDFREFLNRKYKLDETISS